MSTNPYQVLQLPEDATYQQIKERYRHLSKMVHPDKHSIQNYQIAQARFKKIDQAYKSISSDLRRYIFKKYGPTAIAIVENNPFMFQDYEKADFTDPLIINKLDQLMIYCLFEEHASNEIDKTTIKSKSLLMIYRPLNNINLLPSIERSEFCFETALPNLLGMSHTLNITHESEGLSSQAKSDISFGIVSSKRITEALMLIANTNISHDRFSLEAGVDLVINNNLILHFIPINFMNGELARAPQFGADFQRGNFYVSTITNLNQITIQIGSTPLNKTVSKTLKFAFDGSSFAVSPTYEREVTKKLRLFVQSNVRLQGGQGTTNIEFGIAYGYKLKILDELKLEVSSYISPNQSNMSISILTPKFKATIPILSRADMLKFEIYKLGTFIGIYLVFQLYKLYVKRSLSFRKRIEFENYNRLSVEKMAVAKNNSDCSIAATESMETQCKYNGLVILLAYLGSADSVARVKRLLKREINYARTYNIEEILSITDRLENLIKTNNDDFKNELYNIRESVQAKVKGSQLFMFSVEELRVNPCMDQNESYHSLVMYFSRGKVYVKQQAKSQLVSIGKMKQRYWKPWHLRVLDYLSGKMMQ